MSVNNNRVTIESEVITATVNGYPPVRVNVAGRADVATAATQGARGPQGETGATGATGAQGPAGADGQANVIRFDQTTPAATWTIAHALGRYVLAQVYDATGNEIDAEINQTLTTLTVTFGGDSVSGSVVYL